MKQQEKTVNVVEKAKVYIAEHFSGEISLEETAKELGISSYYLSKLFKESENVNYIDYVNNLRIEYAKKQLMETEKSIKEICMESGYGDPNYFSRIFKKWTGVTPTEYREEGRYDYTYKTMDGIFGVYCFCRTATCGMFSKIAGRKDR